MPTTTQFGIAANFMSATEVDGNINIKTFKMSTRNYK